MLNVIEWRLRMNKGISNSPSVEKDSVILTSNSFAVTNKELEFSEGKSTGGYGSGFFFLVLKRRNGNKFSLTIY